MVDTTRAPGRPPARDRLLDAAEELFRERGIAATGVDAVLARAGVAPATLYAHFGGKDHLVAAYLERRLERWRTTWDAALERADSPGSRALSVFDALEEFAPPAATARGCAFLAASVEVVDTDHPARRWLTEDTRLLQERVRELSAATGAADPDALAAELLLLYDGALASRARDGVTGGTGRPPARAGTPTPRDLAAAAVRRHCA